MVPVELIQYPPKSAFGFFSGVPIWGANSSVLSVETCGFAGGGFAALVSSLALDFLVFREARMPEPVE